MEGEMEGMRKEREVVRGREGEKREREREVQAKERKGSAYKSRNADLEIFPLSG